MTRSSPTSTSENSDDLTLSISPVEWKRIRSGALEIEETLADEPADPAAQERAAILAIIDEELAAWSGAPRSSGSMELHRLRDRIASRGTS